MEWSFLPVIPALSLVTVSRVFFPVVLLILISMLICFWR